MDDFDDQLCRLGYFFLRVIAIVTGWGVALFIAAGFGAVITQIIARTISYVLTIGCS